MRVIKVAGVVVSLVIGATVTVAPAAADPDALKDGPRSLAVSSASSSKVQKFPDRGTCQLRKSRGELLPDSKCTPGAISRDGARTDISKTVCKKGWAKTQTGSSSVYAKERPLAARAYGTSEKESKDLVLDHLVPVQLGGAVNDPRNLWLQTPEAARKKNRVDTALTAAVCSGTMSLASAQRVIAQDWTAISVTSSEAGGRR
ncbi:hypothetical protein GCM10009551_053680 [Nocardiopsis tropica]|uniref:hypothetical protein n=1 Tax=Tsukamurella strandjordii TaxID=147577 RepID=UPI0031CF52C5